MHQERDERKTEKQVESQDMQSMWLKKKDALDRTPWKNDIEYHSNDPRCWEKPEEEKREVFRYRPTSFSIR